MAESVPHVAPIAPVPLRRSPGFGALPSVPAHVGAMFGLSVAGYGVALAIVTGLQASADAHVVANRAPLDAAIGRIAAANDRLGRSLEAAAGGYDTAASEYRSLAELLPTVENRLAALSDTVTGVDGAARALPGSVSLPPAVQAVRVSTKARAHATSGGSTAP